MKFQEIVSSHPKVLVDFYAEWCGPCKTLAPILKEFKSQIGDNVKIIKIDVDKNNQVASQLGVRGVPTLVLYKEGQQVWRQSGVLSAQELKQIVDSH